MPAQSCRRGSVVRLETDYLLRRFVEFIAVNPLSFVGGAVTYRGEEHEGARPVNIAGSSVISRVQTEQPAGGPPTTYLYLAEGGHQVITLVGIESADKIYVTSNFLARGTAIELTDVRFPDEQTAIRFVEGDASQKS